MKNEVKSFSVFGGAMLFSCPVFGRMFEFAGLVLINSVLLNQIYIFILTTIPVMFKSYCVPVTLCTSPTEHPGFRIAPRLRDFPGGLAR